MIFFYETEFKGGVKFLTHIFMLFLIPCEVAMKCSSIIRLHNEPANIWKQPAASALFLPVPFCLCFCIQITVVLLCFAEIGLSLSFRVDS